MQRQRLFPRRPRRYRSSEDREVCAMAGAGCAVRGRSCLGQPGHRRPVQADLRRRMDVAHRPGRHQRLGRGAAEQRSPRRRGRRQPAAAPGLLAQGDAAAGRDRRAAAVAGKPGELRGVPRADPQLHRGSAVRPVADAVQQRLGVLERPGWRAGRRSPAQRGRLSRLPRPPRPDPALLRAADRQHAAGPEARLQRAARGAQGPRPVHRRGGGTGRSHGQQLLRAVQADAGHDPRR